MSLDLNDPEVKKEIDAAVEQKISDKIAGLVANKDEILKEKRSLQEKLAVFEGVDPKRLHELEEYRNKNEQKKLVDKAEYEKALAESERIANEQREKTESALKQRNSALKAIALEQALLANNVKNEAYLQAAASMLADKVELAEVDGVLASKIEDKDIKEYIKNWVENGLGKHFATPPQSSGGGSPPGMSQSAGGLYLDEMSTAQKSKFIAAGGDITQLPLSRKSSGNGTGQKPRVI